jgi:hypothetical protein
VVCFQKTKGDAFRVPLGFCLEALLLFLLGFLLCGLFLSCHVFYSPFSIFHGYGGPEIKTAAVECIELLKFEVKKKIDYIVGCRHPPPPFRGSDQVILRQDEKCDA